MKSFLGFYKWVHIDFFFYRALNNDCYLNNDEQFMFEELIRKILLRTRLFVRRKFYLYEPQPNVFLALEVRHIIFIPIIVILVWLYRHRCRFISQMCVHSVGGGDQANGQGFCGVMDAMTDYYLFRRDNKLTHIIHCSLEFQKQSREKEVEFYKEMLRLYEPKKLK